MFCCSPHCPRHKSVVRLDPRTNTWEHLADLPLAGSGVVTFSIERRLLSFLYEWCDKRETGQNMEEYRAVMEYNTLQVCYTTNTADT